MGNTNKQIEEAINEIELSEAELLEIESLQPPNILIKVSLSKDLKFLSNDDKAAIFTNMFNYHTGTELVDMSNIAEMFPTPLQFKTTFAKAYRLRLLPKTSKTQKLFYHIGEVIAGLPM